MAYNPIEPKEVEIETPKGEKRTYILSKIPAIPAREIVAKYPVSNMPKLGDYAVSEEIMIKMISYTAIKTEGGEIPLSTKELINNHVPDWETLARLEMHMMEYNCSFLERAVTSISFDGLVKIARRLITETLTDLSAQSSPKKRRRSKN